MAADAAKTATTQLVSSATDVVTQIESVAAEAVKDVLTDVIKANQLIGQALQSLSDKL